MATSAYVLIDGDFCLCFDWGRLLPVVWLMATSAKIWFVTPSLV